MPIRHGGEDRHRERRQREADPVADDRDPVRARALGEQRRPRCRRSREEGQVDQERHQVPPPLEHDQRQHQPAAEDRHRPGRAERGDGPHRRGEPVRPQARRTHRRIAVSASIAACGCSCGESQTSATASSTARASQSLPLQPSLRGSGGGAPVGRRRSPPTRAVRGRTSLVGRWPGCSPRPPHRAGLAASRGPPLRRRVPDGDPASGCCQRPAALRHGTHIGMCVLEEPPVAASGHADFRTSRREAVCLALQAGCDASGVPGRG